MERQAYFNSTLFQYLVIFSGLGILVTSIVHFYLTKKIIRPIHHLIESIKMLKHGSYPPQIKEISDDEIGELITHYNELIVLLKKNELQREKLVADISHELDRKSTRLNSSHVAISYAVFCLRKKRKAHTTRVS